MGKTERGQCGCSLEMKGESDFFNEAGMAMMRGEGDLSMEGLGTLSRTSVFYRKGVGRLRMVLKRETT